MTNSSEGPSLAADRASDFSASTALGPPPALQTSEPMALFLDFDGTLVEIADHPDDVIVPPGLPALLEGISTALAGRVAIVTGRSIAALEALLGPVRVAIAGSHGGEFRSAPAACVEPLAAPLPHAVVARLNDMALANGGLLVEPKPFSAAVHYRHHPEARENVLDCARRLATEFGLDIKHGKQVVEVTMPGSDKGTAVTRFMDLSSFRGATPIFLGDDVTDEDAFVAVRKQRGHGVLVGAQRPTAATFRLDGVGQVHDWLQSGFRAFQKGDFRA